MDKWVDECFGEDSSEDTDDKDTPYRVHAIEQVRQDDLSEEETPPLEERVLESSDIDAGYDSEDSSDHEDF